VLLLCFVIHWYVAVTARSWNKVLNAFTCWRGRNFSLPMTTVPSRNICKRVITRYVYALFNALALTKPFALRATRGHDAIFFYFLTDWHFWKNFYMEMLSFASWSWKCNLVAEISSAKLKNFSFQFCTLIRPLNLNGFLSLSLTPIVLEKESACADRALALPEKKSACALRWRSATSGSTARVSTLNTQHSLKMY
jgi:hypothetical protein